MWLRLLNKGFEVQIQMNLFFFHLFWKLFICIFSFVYLNALKLELAFLPLTFYCQAFSWMQLINHSKKHNYIGFIKCLKENFATSSVMYIVEFTLTLQLNEEITHYLLSVKLLMQVQVNNQSEKHNYIRAIEPTKSFSTKLVM